MLVWRPISSVPPLNRFVPLWALWSYSYFTDKRDQQCCGFNKRVSPVMETGSNHTVYCLSQQKHSSITNTEEMIHNLPTSPPIQSQQLAVHMKNLSRTSAESLPLSEDMHYHWKVSAKVPVLLLRENVSYIYALESCFIGLQQVVAAPQPLTQKRTLEEWRWKQSSKIWEEGKKQPTHRLFKVWNGTRRWDRRKKWAPKIRNCRNKWRMATHLIALREFNPKNGVTSCRLDEEHCKHPTLTAVASTGFCEWGSWFNGLSHFWEKPWASLSVKGDTWKPPSSYLLSFRDPCIPIDISRTVCHAIDKRNRQFNDSIEYKALALLEEEQIERLNGKDQLQREDRERKHHDEASQVDPTSQSKSAELEKNYDEHQHSFPCGLWMNDEKFHERWSFVLKHLFKISDRISTGNRVTLLTNGDDIFDSILQEVDKASKRVWVESYIFDASPIGEKFVEVIVNAKKRGCDCILIIDWLGSWDTNPSLIQRLRDEGVTVVVFNEISHFWGINRRRMGYRDHRKIAIIDNVGFCGSANIAKEAGGPKYGNSRFWDIHVKLEGPAVAHLTEVFRGTLASSQSGVTRPPLFPAPLPISEELGGGSLIQILESDRRRGIKEIQIAYELLVKNSVESLSILTSYFVPPKFLKRALEVPLQRGVPISLFLSGNSDVWGDVLTTNYVLSKLLRRCRYHDVSRNITVWRSTDCHLHAKAITIDGMCAVIGSYNWDRLSAQRNLEVAVCIIDPKFVHQLEMVQIALTKEKAERERLGDLLGILKIANEGENLAKLTQAYQHEGQRIDREKMNLEMMEFLNKYPQLIPVHLTKLTKLQLSNDFKMDSLKNKWNSFLNYSSPYFKYSPTGSLSPNLVSYETRSFTTQIIASFRDLLKMHTSLAPLHYNSTFTNTTNKDKEEENCLSINSIVEKNLKPAISVVTDQRLPLLINVTEERRFAPALWKEYILYQLIRWSGGFECDQFVGQIEREAVNRHNQISLKYSKKKGKIVTTSKKFSIVYNILLIRKLSKKKHKYRILKEDTSRVC